MELRPNGWDQPFQKRNGLMGVPYAEVVGDPVAHSKSPLIHKFWLDRMSLRGDYRATRVKPGELAGYLTKRRHDPDWRGCNVTMPLKVAMLEHITDLNEEAQWLGAVNCVRRTSKGLFGTNFDADAIRETLMPLEPLGRVVVLGAGGAAKAAIWALELLDRQSVTVMSRDASKARAMLDRLAPKNQVADFGALPECDLLINATPLGMAGYPSHNMDLASIAPRGAVFDMVYSPLETQLLADARRQGLCTVSGLQMLIEQAHMSFATFYRQVPSQSLIEEVREFITQ